MRTDITRDFAGAEEKGLKVFYNDDLGQFDVETQDGIECVGCFDDECNEEMDASNGEAEKQVRELIKGY